MSDKVITLPGNKGKVDPTLVSEATRPPEHLDDDARAEWLRLCDKLVTKGLLTAETRGLFAGYCAAWSQMIQHQAHVKEHGELLSRYDAPRPTKNPHHNMALEAAKEVRAFADALGIGKRERAYAQTQATTDNDKAEKARRLLR